MTQTIIIALAGLYFLQLSAIMNTTNVRSALYFKFFPLVFGVLLVFIAVARYMGWPI